MTDLCERLRTWMQRDATESLDAIMNEAAAEIERLRNTISQLRAVAGAVSVESPSYADIKREARYNAYWMVMESK